MDDGDGDRDRDGDGDGVMDFQVVVLAGGVSSDLSPLVSPELPNALLPVANRPVLSFVLDLIEASNIKDLIVVVEGEDTALRVGGWIFGAYVNRLQVEVAAVAEDIGTVGALRAVAHRLTAHDILVLSGDLVTDISLGVIAATHRRHGAIVTALLCSVPMTGLAEAGPVIGGKDKVRKPPRYNTVGLDPTQQFLMHIATWDEAAKYVRVQKRILQEVGQMEIRTDLMDAHIYAFNRIVLQDVLNKKESFHSVSQDILPYLVRTQLRSEVASNGISNVEGKSNVVIPQKNLIWLSNHREVAPSAFNVVPAVGSNDSVTGPMTHKCCAYIASKSKYCSRLNSIQAYGDINHDVVGEASHLSGYSFSAQNNIVHPSALLGSKTTVGPHCMLAEGSKLGDKCSIKRSVIGRHCRIGSNVKIVNSVVMNHVTIEDGCLVQGSVICNNVQLQERVILKDCQVGAGYIVASGGDHKSESLTKT